jgi:hypothetical protein
MNKPLSVEKLPALLFEKVKHLAEPVIDLRISSVRDQTCKYGTRVGFRID